jgi:hypothetical protein
MHFFTLKIVVKPHSVSLEQSRKWNCKKHSRNLFYQLDLVWWHTLFVSYIERFSTKFPVISTESNSAHLKWASLHCGRHSLRKQTHTRRQSVNSERAAEDDEALRAEWRGEIRCLQRALCHRCLPVCDWKNNFLRAADILRANCMLPPAAAACQMQSHASPNACGLFARLFCWQWRTSWLVPGISRFHSRESSFTRRRSRKSGR